MANGPETGGHGSISIALIVLLETWNVTSVMADQLRAVGYVIDGGVLEVARCRKVVGETTDVAGVTYARWT